MIDDTPRAWVGCLGCYNAGYLVGRWVDGTEASDEGCDFDKALEASINDDGKNRVRVEHMGFGHEEWWVMDHENYGPALKGECSPYQAQRVAEVLEAIDADGFEFEAVANYFDYYGKFPDEWDAPTREDFRDHYHGHYDSVKDFAYEWVEECGLNGIRVPSELEPYIDWDQVVTTFESDFNICERDDHSVDVFSY